jgi:membrane protease subunit (stomatin/prohibitin family)
MAFPGHGAPTDGRRSMGLFSAIKGEARRVFISRPDEFKNDIIYKHPDSNIRWGTQLTVMADEQALFLRDGKVVGTIGPGRHTLEASNFPFLSMLIDAVTGGNLFITEIYFVSTREISQIKFGGPIGDVRDPGTGLAVGTMVHGDFSLRVIDPERLVIGLVGLQRSTNDAFIGWFKNLLLKTIRDHVAELLVKKQWPLLDVTSGAYTEEIEEEVVEGAKKHIDGYGLTVVRLGNFTIAIKAEDEETLKKFKKDVAYSRLAGGFQQYAAGAAMLGAGEGMAQGGGGGGGGGGGNAALGGAGLGVGFGMANMFMAQQQHQPHYPGAGGGFPPQGGPYGGAPAMGAAGAMGAAAAGGGATVTCQACNASVPPGKFCANCGQQIQAPEASGPKFCNGCGGELSPGARFCPGCGNQVGG